MQTNSKVIQTIDLIPVGIYTAIYFILVAIATALCVLIVPGYSFVFIPVFASFLCGSVYMLSAARIPRFGAISLMGSIMGVFFFVSGKFPGALLPAVIISVLADALAYKAQYRLGWELLLSYIVFSFSTIGPTIPLFLNPTQYIADLERLGRDASYIQSVFDTVSHWTGLIVVLGIVIGAICGGLFGERLMRRHFKKVG